MHKTMENASLSPAASFEHAKESAQLLSGFPNSYFLQFFIHPDVEY